MKLIRACLHAVKCPKMVKQAGVRLRQTHQSSLWGRQEGLLSQISSGLHVIGLQGNLETWEGMAFCAWGGRLISCTRVTVLVLHT